MKRRTSSIRLGATLPMVSVALPVRKRLDHRGPLSVDVSGAWYFITICAEGHKPWVATKWPKNNDGARSNADDGRAVAPRLEAPSGCFAGGYPRPPTGVPSFDDIADAILREARENHVRGIWRLALFLVMPDHLHFIVHIPGDGRRGAPTLPKLVANFKHLLAARYRHLTGTVPEYRVLSESELLLTIKALPEGSVEKFQQKTRLIQQKTAEIHQKKVSVQQKTSDDSTEKSEMMMESILSLLRENPSISQKAVAAQLGTTRENIVYWFGKLKSKGRLIRRGPDKGGEWVVTK